MANSSTHRIHIIQGLPATSLTVALSVVLSVVIAAWAWSDRPAKETRARVAANATITVKGKATRRIRADRGVWQSTLQAQGGTLKEAFDVLHRDLDRVRAFLGEQAFEADEVLESAISTVVRYERNAKNQATDVIKGYTLSQTITVTSTRLAHLGRAASSVTDLIGQGIHIVSNAPEYVATSLPDVKAQIIGAATANARHRAELMVRESGGQLGNVRHIRQGVIQVVRPNSTAMTSYGIYDTSTIEKDASVVVTVDFAVQ